MKKLANSVKYIILIVLGIIFIFPFFWMISCAFRTPDALLSSPPRFLPTHPTVSAFIHVLLDTEVPRYFFNSIIVAVTATVICIVIALPAGYSFARHNFRMKNLILVIVLMCNMIPQASTLVPLYRALNWMKLLDSKFAIAFTHLLCMLPFSVIMVRGFIKSIPKTLEEAAIIDGCSKTGVLFKIILPVTKSGVFATAMYAFMISWEEFLYAMTFSVGKNSRTISVGLQLFSGEFKTDWASILASSVLMTIPILVIFFCIQDTFIANATGGALKE